MNVEKAAAPLDSKTLWSPFSEYTDASTGEFFEVGRVRVEHLLMIRGLDATASVVALAAEIVKIDGNFIDVDIVRKMYVAQFNRISKEISEQF